MCVCVVTRTHAHTHWDAIHKLSDILPHTLGQVRVFDTAGLDSYAVGRAFGVKLVAAGYQKEACEIAYVTREEDPFRLPASARRHVREEEERHGRE